MVSRKLSFLFATLILTHSLYAADYVVSTPTVVQNGGAGNVINGGDTLRVTSTGSITTTTAATPAIVGTGNFNIVNNEGALTTSGATSSGISLTAGTGNALINNNLITTSGSTSHGISSSTSNSQLVNKGTILFSGSSSSGLFSSASGSSLINTGAIISTAVTDGDGIEANTGFQSNLFLYNSGFISGVGSSTAGMRAFNRTTTTVVNAGSIVQSGSVGVGISAQSGTGNTITNTGSILVKGPNSIGMNVSNNGSTPDTINNTGSIVTLGANSFGIRVIDGETINNSGRVVSYQSTSTAFTLFDSNFLNLSAPGFIGGVINLGTNTTLTLLTGPSQSVLWDLSTGTMVGGAPTITGSVPAFYNAVTSQFATYDPTVFTGQRDELADVSGAASMLIQTRLDNACCRRSCEGNLWVSGFGSTYKYGSTSATLDYHYKYWGVVAGYDKVIWNNFILGAFAGYGKGFLNSDARFVQSIDNEADGAIMGLYGRQNCGRLFVDLGFSFGNLDHSNSRFVNDNLAPLGESFATSSHNDWWLSPEIAIGANFNKFGCWTISPNARYRYAWESIKSYTESGSSSNASVSGQSIAIGEFKGEFAAKKNMNCGCVTGRIGYLLRHRLGNLSTNVTMIGQTVSIPLFYNHRNAGYIGLDAEFAIGSCTKFNIGGELTGGGGIKGMKGEMAVITVF